MRENLNLSFAELSPFDALAAKVQSFQSLNIDFDRAKSHRFDDAERRKRLKELAAAVQNPAWTEFCRAKPRSKKINSGITYISQFLAHDMVESATKHALFSGRKRSLVDTPLVLSTIYGDGPDGEKEVFDEGYFRCFRTKTGFVPKFFVNPFSIGDSSFPLLADQRNQDNPILMQVAAIFMRHHNLTFSSAKKLFSKKEDNYIAKCFTYARIANILAWHKIINANLLESICVSSDADTLSSIIRLDEIARNRLAASIFRGFHSMPLAKYDFSIDSMGVTIAKMLGRQARGRSFTGKKDGELFGWRLEWEVDWSLFIDSSVSVGNYTVFSPSFEFVENTKPISLLDFEAASIRFDQLPANLRVSRDLIEEFYRELDAVLGTANYWSDYHSSGGLTPLMLEYQIEAFYQSGADGRLGPIGSEVFRYFVLTGLSEAMSEVKSAARKLGLEHLPDPAALPDDFSTLIDNI